MPIPAKPASVTKLLDAAVTAIRHRGYAATSVDDICRAAGFSKGAFFHHFKSKEDLAFAAAEHFADYADALFDAAPFMNLEDPRARVLAYLDFRKSILRGDPGDYACLLGTIVQEAHETHPALRDACGGHIEDHAERIARDLAAAKMIYAPDADWRPESVALFTQAVLQGAFILAKAKDGSRVAADCLDHLSDYVERLLPRGRDVAKPETEKAA
jgi:TetR/AcrR family transcriptional repressor of nem operon